MLGLAFNIYEYGRRWVFPIAHIYTAWCNLSHSYSFCVASGRQVRIFFTVASSFQLPILAMCWSGGLTHLSFPSFSLPSHMLCLPKFWNSGCLALKPFLFLFSFLPVPTSPLICFKTVASPFKDNSVSSTLLKYQEKEYLLHSCVWSEAPFCHLLLLTSCSLYIC